MRKITVIHLNDEEGMPQLIAKYCGEELGFQHKIVAEKSNRKLCKEYFKIYPTIYVDKRKLKKTIKTVGFIGDIIHVHQSYELLDLAIRFFSDSRPIIFTFNSYTKYKLKSKQYSKLAAITISNKENWRSFESSSNILYSPPIIDTELFRNRYKTYNHGVAIWVVKNQEEIDKITPTLNKHYRKSAKILVLSLTNQEKTITPYSKVPELLDYGEFVYDLTLNSEKELNEGFSTIGLQALALGKKVIVNNQGRLEMHSTDIPEENKPENCAKLWKTIYEKRFKKIVG